MGLYNPPRVADRGVPALLALYGRFARPLMPPGFRYLLMLRRNEAGQPIKPMAFQDLSALARHLHRARDGSGLQLAETPVLLAGRDASTIGVSVWTIDDAGSGDRRRYLGWAYVNGAGRTTLEAALRLEQPGPVH